MARTELCIVLASACGRFDFDRIDDGSRDGANGTCLSTELCNGIDDNCNGLVDEACPCTPFDQQYAGTFEPVLLSLGDGYAVHSGGNYVRIDGRGTQIGSQSTPARSGDRQMIVWNGSTIAYIIAGPPADHLGFATIDGIPIGEGPALGVPVPTAAELRWRGGGYDVADAPLSGPYSLVRTDASGAPLASAQHPTTAIVVVAIAVVRSGDTTAGVWLEQDGLTLTETAFVAAAAPPADLMPVSLPERMTSVYFGGAASNGSRVLVAWDGKLFAVDGTTVTSVPITAPDPVIDVGWTGDRWTVLTVSMLTPSPTVVSLTELDASLALVTPTATLVSVSYTSTLRTDFRPTIYADATRTAILWSYQIDTQPPISRIVQQCH